jgi:reverse transcriptase-like protein
VKRKLHKRLLVDREKWWKTKVIELEKNMKRNNVQRVFEILNLTKKKKIKIDVVKDKDGVVLKEEEKQLLRWKAYFEELLNVESHVEVKEDKESEWKEDEKQDQCPTVEEVGKAVESLKSFKAAGPDGIVAELLKAGGNSVVKWLHRIIQKIWTGEQVVEEWKTCTIVPLFKKGDAEVCDNYRGISLLSIPSKVLAKVLYKRIEHVVEPKLHEAQCGFRKGRGCVDQIFSLKECLSMARQKDKSVYMCFVDLRKAYDSVNRELLWTVMKEYGVSEKIVKILQSLYDNTRAQVRVKGELSEYLSLKTGVKQGCVLSPLLFNIFLDWVMRRVLNVVGNKGIKIRFNKARKGLNLRDKEFTEEMMLDLLMYADDMVVLGEDFDSVKKFMIELDQQLISAGMMMNVKKTKMMVMNGKIDEPIVLRGEKIEVEDKFPYLGVTVRADQNSAREEVEERIVKAVKVFRALYHPLWKRKQVSTETKVAMYRAAVIPVLLYGCEAWVLSVKESERLEVFQMKCLRVILGITKRDHRTNEEIRKETGQGEIGEILTRNRLRWLGHVARMSADRVPVRLLYGEVGGRRKPGHPIARWKDMVANDIKKRKITSWYDMAKHRDVWRKVVRGEKVDAAMRRRKRGEVKEDGRDDDDDGTITSTAGRKGRIGTGTRTAGITCPGCGKAYVHYGEWFRRHVAGCPAAQAIRS